MPIAFGWAGRGMQHCQEACHRAFLLFPPKQIRFGNLVRLCFKTTLAIHTVSQYLLLSTGLVTKPSFFKWEDSGKEKFKCLNIMRSKSSGR